MNTYCPLPFEHLYVAETGEVKPCCVSKSLNSKPNVNHQRIEDIYNNKDFIQLRKEFLNNRKPNVCSHCWELENTGKRSYRINSINKNRKEVLTDTVPVQFKSIDIRFSNICNLKCIMCGPNSSHLHNNGVVIKIKEDFINQIKKYLPYIESAYFAGGEPLVMDEHYEILKFLSKANPNTLLSYNTNLQTLEKGKYKVLDLWSKFNFSPYVTVSCDGLYEKGSKIRVNFDTEKFIANINILRQNNINYEISFTVGTYNIADIPLFIEQVQELNLVDNLDKIKFQNIVNYPKKYNISSLPLSTKHEIADKLRLVKTHEKDLQELIDYMFKNKTLI